MTDPDAPTAAHATVGPADRQDQPLLRVLLVDDEALVRDGLQLILERVGGFTVVGHAADGAVLSPTVTRAVIDRFARRPAAGDHDRRIESIDQLTDREREVLVAVAGGGSNAEVAKRLHLSEATVKTHLSRLLTKLGLANRVQAAILAHRAGLLD